MLEVSNITIAYRSTGATVVDDISFTVKKGDRIAILGPSGCGKTTILTMIAGILKETDANIKGKIVFTPGTVKKIGFIFQNPALLPWETTYENIAFVLGDRILEQEKNDRVGEMIRLVGLGGYENYYPYQLSVGMQQRVNFARALAVDPSLLLMDEPFSALDSETKKNIQEAFLKILKEKKLTTIFVTHSMEEAVFLADRIIVLSKNPARIKTIFENGKSELLGGKKDFSELYED